MIDYASSGDVAVILGVSKRRVFQLVKDRADFPRPHRLRGPTGRTSMFVWDRGEVERWSRTADRRPGRRKQSTNEETE